MNIRNLSPTFSGYILTALYRLEMDSKDYKLTADGFEIHNEQKLKKEGDLIVEIAEKIEEKRKPKQGAVKATRIVPLTGNEKGSYKQLAKDLGTDDEDTPVSELLYKYFNATNTIESKYTLPSFLVPEFYEFNRMLGYKDSLRKSEKDGTIDEYMLGIAGYVASYLDRVKIGNNEYVEVHLFPLYGERTSTEMTMTLIDLFEQLRFNFAGISPVTSLLLWLALKTNYKGSVEVMALSPGGGQAPTTVWASYNLNLLRVSEALSKIDEKWKDPLEGLLRKSFNQKEDNIVETRISRLLYEVINGAKPRQELLYVGAREGVLAVMKQRVGQRLTGDDKRLIYYAKLIDHIYRKL